MISIIDYGVGNLASISNMLNSLDLDCNVIKVGKDVATAEKLILPGVGSFDHAMSCLNKNPDLVVAIKNACTNENKPILGICLGMQLLFEKSEEGMLNGLGLIEGQVNKFQNCAKLKIPHMGWNYVNPSKPSKLFSDMVQPLKYYFAHSYYVNPKCADDILCTTEYGTRFCSAVERNNIFGVQFHPEKSHRFGKLLLKNFAEL